VLASARRTGYLGFMFRLVPAIVSLLLLGATLGGCTKCGFIWDDLGHSCHASAPR